ncbi:MAG: DNA methyltransferase [Streptosporangiaceae bacterium]
MTAGDMGTRLNYNALLSMRAAALSRAPISLGPRRTTSPHEFYRYPGRFSPDFARAAIEAFSQLNELVLDPFVGGGTTAVEALSSGRRCIVADLNPLATFVTRVKTQPLEGRSQRAVRRWIEQLPRATLLSRALPVTDIWLDQGYLNGLDTRLTWRVTKIIRLALAAVDPLDPRTAAFCRCIVLRTAQWALDMRRTIPSVEQFRSALVVHGHAMLSVAAAFAESLPDPSYLPYVMDQGVPGLADALSNAATNSPALVLTSPPYPGVYVNYHRWKLLGRKEIRAPFWITNQLDGHGLAHYTMHARAEPTLTTYFDRLRVAFEDIARLVTPGTTVVQLVGFSNPPDQLSRYLCTMNDAGFQEVVFPKLGTGEDGRLWRSVPSRRWWTEAQSRRSVAPHTAREVVLIHRLKRA